MKCDTCHREVPEVSRVVIYVGYNKLSSKAIYNCPECFAKKEKTKAYSKEGCQDKSWHPQGRVKPGPNEAS